MIRIINFRTKTKESHDLQWLLEKKYGPLRGRIEKLHVVRRAVDARKKPQIFFVYTVFLVAKEEAKVLKALAKDKNCSAIHLEAPDPIVYGEQTLAHRPVVVGFGPAGLMAAYYLAREGYRPIVLERGQDVDQRTADVEAFWVKGEFKANSNVQFGEGGAGTFSDGKLTTRVTHPRLHEIAQAFVDYGAPEEILYKHKPHVGTDILRTMVKNMREQIKAWGGEVRFGAQLTDIEVEHGHLKAIEVNGGERIEATELLLAVGHSARDTYEMLHKRGLAMESKPFAIGVRIEHKQSVIDQSQYGVSPEDIGLGAADYSLVYHDSESDRTAYSFCMCPGGQVVASASEDGGIVTNGMSYYARNSGVANSALVVTVSPRDYGDHPLAGVNFQRQWEEKAFVLGGGAYRAPAQSVGNFLGQDYPCLPEKGVTTYRPGVTAVDLHDCLPEYVTDVLSRALPYFGKRIAGFDDPAVCMTGVETRTSSPLRMTRTESRQSTSIRGMYPMGEGAGFAGGIMSAALDGAETAIEVMKQYKPLRDREE